MKLPIERLNSRTQPHPRGGAFELAPETAATLIDVAESFKLLWGQLQLVVIKEAAVGRQTREVRVGQLANVFANRLGQRRAALHRGPIVRASADRPSHRVEFERVPRTIRSLWRVRFAPNDRPS